MASETSALFFGKMPLKLFVFSNDFVAPNIAHVRTPVKKVVTQTVGNRHGDHARASALGGTIFL
jgi:hypothetical protein